MTDSQHRPIRNDSTTPQLNLSKKLFRNSRTPRALLFGPAATGDPKLKAGLNDPAFRHAYSDACSRMEERTGFSPDQLPPSFEGASAFHRRFLREVAIQLAMFRALREQGHVFQASAGISLGEIAAANAAGAISFEEAIRVACVMAETVVAATGGDLIVAEADLGTLRLATGNLSTHSLIQWPSSTVLAVSDVDMKEFTEQCREAAIVISPLGIRCMPHTDGVRTDVFRRALGDLESGFAKIPFYSCVTGGRVTGEVDREFWVAMMSRGVNFSEMYSALHRDGFSRLIYIGSVSIERQAFGHIDKKNRPRVVRGSRLLRPRFTSFFQ